MKNTISWDIFCKVVDNFGDIGVCWRLSKQLAHEYGLPIRLWVDDLNVAAKLLPNLNTSLSSQHMHGVEVRQWPQDEQAFASIQPAEVVIEAFACDLPQTYVANMAKSKPIWLNLEYLSAEKWVDAFHAQHSIHPATGLKKTFFFPGFSANTGGLIREQGLSQERTTFNKRPSSLWQSLNVKLQPDALNVSLFCYPHAPINSLLESMAQGSQAIQLFVPSTTILPKLAQYFGKSNLSIGESASRGQLSVTVLPFLSQDDYDKLLWACDLNFVRGEDSWIRALWSARPFIWQTYPQDEDLHLIKLKAFLAVYTEDDNALSQLNQAWLDAEITPALWDAIVLDLAKMQKHAEKQTDKFEKQADLAAKLLSFTKNQV